ncbi:hypothetical protein HGRIS_009200 [Hohenbuehelia grisea]|uniref:ABC transporter domain-containing protein n=1 Tax=Hohenbuehelia grisea TaxID=104357 RepID=A0ABR3J0H5_9AGAR
MSTFPIRRKQRNRKGVFNPEDTANVRHTRVGIWDLYEEIDPKLAKIPGASRLETYLDLGNSLPFVWRMLKDVGSIRSCWTLLFGYLVMELAAALIPALSLWYSSQLLVIVEKAVEHRSVDQSILFKIAAGRFTCSCLKRIFVHIKRRLSVPLNQRIKQHYSAHIFSAMARLDVPTFDDPLIQRQLEAALPANSRSSIAWDTMQMTSRLVSTVVQLLSQLGVLVGVLREQQDGVLLALLSFVPALLHWNNVARTYFNPRIWAATTKNEEYIKMEGMKRVVNNASHRKEIVAGGMWEHLVKRYNSAIASIGDAASSYTEARTAYTVRDRLTIQSFLEEPMRELPQIVFTLRAVQHPAAIPLSLASLNLITQTTTSFSYVVFQFLAETGSIAEQFAGVRKLYEIRNIPNKIADGTIPYPENAQSLNQGVAIEFRNVSFKYPGSEQYALRNTSFKIKQGQLCVIVGSNGSGKSTILKLIARLYDPTEGEIYIDDREIRTLRLADLRRAMSVLFQDYTHFPLSIKDNIGLGDPAHADDEGRIKQAAALGGATEFIERLDEGFDTYLERPVRDHYSGLPEGTTTLFGRPVDYTNIRGVGGMESTNSSTLSGGQMQRIALSRSFMRSLVSEEPGVGLLLFDEPSASLDPTAEHDLFERLRQLRGNKTMIFSSHRFGNLTRHADLILYMNDSVVQEEGTHESLIRQEGEYARIWMLQARAFLP